MSSHIIIIMHIIITVCQLLRWMTLPVTSLAISKALCVFWSRTISSAVLLEESTISTLTPDTQTLISFIHLQHFWTFYCEYYTRKWTSSVFSIQLWNKYQIRRCCCWCYSPSYRLVSCCQVLGVDSWWSRQNLLLQLFDPTGHKQLDKLDVSDNQIGVPRCVVSIHTPGIGPMCLQRCEPYDCSVVNNIQNPNGQMRFSLVWAILFYRDKCPVLTSAPANQ